jgi:hypothetical protein
MTMQIKFKNAIDYGSNPGALGMELAVSIYSEIEKSFRQTLYPDYLLKELVTDAQKVKANPGAKDYVYRIIDYRGAAGWIGDVVGHNIPEVGLATGAGKIKMAFSGCCYKIYDTDAMEFEFGMTTNLDGELKKAAAKACLNHLEVSSWYGDQSVGFQGGLSHEYVDTTTAAPHTEGGTDTEWDSKSGEEMVADVNEALITIMDNGLMVYMPNVVMLPIKQFLKIATAKLAIAVEGGGTVVQNALEYLKKNNAYTQATGKELKVVPIRYLKGAGTGATDRMIVQAQSEEYQIMPIAMPYQLRPPVPIPLGALTVAWQKHGSYAILHPASTLYVDGI